MGFYYRYKYLQTFKVTLYVPDDVLEEASASKYQMLLTKSKLRYQKELEKCTQLQCVRRMKEIDKKCHDGIF
jgi:hypothetical protein